MILKKRELIISGLQNNVIRSQQCVYIEDIYSFAVNTINIVIEWNENNQYFHECKARVKIWMFSLHEMKIVMVFTEKE